MMVKVVEMTGNGLHGVAAVMEIPEDLLMMMCAMVEKVTGDGGDN